MLLHIRSLTFHPRAIDREAFTVIVGVDRIIVASVNRYLIPGFIREDGEFIVEVAYVIFRDGELYLKQFIGDQPRQQRQCFPFLHHLQRVHLFQ
ncbi:hypothetical protein D3C76_1599410 [compost metagenome]